ncbi:MAG: family 10 glycosylhydrolase, partial [Planctomycetota bacterium]
VAADIAANYDVDGIHLDYVRWLGDTSWQNLPHDADSYQLFTSTTGQPATSANAAAYRQFIRDRITQLVTQVGDSIDTVDSNVELSAAVWRDPDVGSSQVLQQYRKWMEQDLVDTIIPMIYLSPSNNNLFVPNLTNVMSINTNARVAPGIGVYLHDDPDFTVSQLQTLVDLNAGGATLFAYDSFFGSGQLGVDRFNTIKTFLDSVDSSGGNDQLVSITDFEVDEGYFGSSATFSGSNSGILSASADRVTTEAFRGVGSQQIDINGSPSGWLLRHVSGIGPNNQIASPAGNLPLDSDGHVGVWLKTFDEGIDVRLAVDDPGTADRGVAKRLIADGQWHLYEWSFDNNAEWEAWVTGDGLITGESVTLDSIQFFGSGDATIWMDEVGQNPNGSLWSIYVNGDINSDGNYDCSDVDQLVAAIASGSGELSSYDLTGDGQIDSADLTEWLSQAGSVNLGDGISYLLGDANLDGQVDVSDFNRWNANKFTASTGYCGGDFNADGVTDVSDFNLWNTNKFQSADNATVPEPPAATLFLVLFIASVAITRRTCQ